ncbi:MAG: hypothetical protein J5881_00980 [Clostridia bacterium]|nr:hypothetical protein [Clostridia bacterium]
MESERKSIWVKIKDFFKKIFKNKKIEALPQPEEKQKENIEGYQEEQQQKNVKSKEECLELYKKIKNDQLDIKTLTEEDLIMFIKLGTEELKFLEKRIENEKTEYNMYLKEIEFYQNILEETA